MLLKNYWCCIDILLICAVLYHSVQKFVPFHFITYFGNSALSLWLTFYPEKRKIMERTVRITIIFSELQPRGNGINFFCLSASFDDDNNLHKRHHVNIKYILCMGAHRLHKMLAVYLSPMYINVMMDYCDVCTKGSHNTIVYLFHSKIFTFNLLFYPNEKTCIYWYQALCE